MAAKSTVVSVTSKPRTRRTRKTKTIKVVPEVLANIVHLSTERRKEAAQAKWSEALKIYLGTLNHNDFNIAEHVIKFVCQKPLAIDISHLCEVIPFPIERRLAKKEAQQ
jgi:hypothetical protein